MADYGYEAIDRDGRRSSGRVSASSNGDAVIQLRRQGLTPLEVLPVEDLAVRGRAPAPGGASGLLRFGRRAKGRIKPVRILEMTRELATMLRAGLPLDRSLKVLMEMAPDAFVRTMLEDLIEHVKAGKGLSQALAGHSGVFSDFYVNMVRAGEASGQLGLVLTRLAEHLERARILRNSVVSALIYPLILLVVALLSVFVMLAFVVPQFESLFEDMGDGLPAATQFVVAAGEMVAEYWWAMLLTLLVVLLGADQLQRSERGRMWRDRQMLRFPWLGAVIRDTEISRFVRTMGTLLGSGVSMLESIRIAVETVGNGFMREQLHGLVPKVKQGGRFTDGMDETRLFSPLAVQMAQVGEETGRLDEMLLDLARVIDDEVQTGVKRVISILEPVLILVLGAIIAGIILSILLGIMSVNQLVG